MSRRSSHQMKGRTRIRSLAAGLLVLAALSTGQAFLLLSPWPCPCTTPAEPSRNIEDYILFAYDRLEFKGDDTGNGSRGHINGSVGVNGVGFYNGNDWRLTMGEVYLPDGSQAVADTVQLNSTAHLWDLFAICLGGGSAPVAPYPAGHPAWHAGLYVARAGARRGGRLPGRPVFAWLHSLRDAERHPALRR